MTVTAGTAGTAGTAAAPGALPTGVEPQADVRPPTGVEPQASVALPTGGNTLTGIEPQAGIKTLTGVEPQLRNMAELMRLLGDPQDRLRYIHVAGSNGKGSTCAMLAAVLTACGYRTGLYTSPHLVSPNERFVVDGHQADDGDLAELAARVSAAAGAADTGGVDDAGRTARAGGAGGASAEGFTEFELLTATAFLYFLEKRCEIVVLEAGLGGRLDATNVIGCPELAVITNIALEHTDRLGDSLDAIALEKSGIIKPGGMVVLGPGARAAKAVFERACQQRQAKLLWVGQDEAAVRHQGPSGQVFDWHGHQGLRIGLLGQHQIENATVALNALECLADKGWAVDGTALRQGLATVRWPARLEILSEQPLFVLDGAHNPDGLKSLLQGLEPLLPQRKAVFLAGVMADKEYRQMLGQIAPYAHQLFCLSPDSDKALPAGQLAGCAQSLGIAARACNDIDAGIAAALQAARAGQPAVQPGQCLPVVVFGSLYLAGAVRERYLAMT